ncbi:MAG: hypothetical protein GWN00_22895 [Aliifodinibius sp.]|nr:hypothetical protein [Fodinibius sp.]NIY27548.1 hypothetical protein [Fodinibius sp.]
MATYIVAEYCSSCDTYFKRIGRGPYGACKICNSPLVGKMVEKYSDKDPNTKAEVVNIAYNENPRYSAALGVSETQIEEARKAHPGTEWKKFGHSYRPLIKHRNDKLRLMREAKMEEFGPEQFKGKEG